ncbi:hypothetical protein B0H10DRAFT_2193095 [Mycena sp. CBHHK59/15]|nr:hypothetical protein B0H10DRAFT_2193095 [Mycena sp. CBHHK59/15]
MKTPPMDYPDPDMKPPHQFANWPSFICTPAQPVQPACMVQKRDEAHITQGAISEITVNIFTWFKHRRGVTHYSEVTRAAGVHNPGSRTAPCKLGQTNGGSGLHVPSRGSRRLSAGR